MEKHVHDWHFDAFGDGIIAMCISRDCDMELTAVEVSRRLNATERLPAWWIGDIVEKLDVAMDASDGGYSPSMYQALAEYKAALEGEDGAP